MKNIYLVFDNGEYAKAEKIHAGQNLLNFIEQYNPKICHVCESYSEAVRIAAFWNESHENNRRG